MLKLSGYLVKPNIFITFVKNKINKQIKGMVTNIIEVIGNAASFDVSVNCVNYRVNIPVANMPRVYEGAKFNYHLPEDWSEEKNNLVIKWMQNWIDREAVLKYIATIADKEKVCGVITSLGYNIRVPSRVISEIIKSLFDSISQKDILKHGKILFNSAKKTIERKEREKAKKAPVFKIAMCGKLFTLCVKNYHKNRFGSIEEGQKYYQQMANCCVIKYAGFGDKLHSLGYKLYQEGPTVQKIYGMLSELPEKSVINSAKLLMAELKATKNKRVKTKKKIVKDEIIDNEVKFLLGRLRNDIVYGNKQKCSVTMAGIHVATYKRLDIMGIKYEVTKWTTHLYAPEKGSKEWGLLFNEPIKKEIEYNNNDIEILKDILINGSNEEKAIINSLIESHNEKANERKRIEAEIEKLKEKLNSL